jgi:PKD repeat protein
VLPNTSTIALGQMGAFWKFGDGASATQYDGVHQYTAAGTYAVKLLAVSEFDCKDSITKNVTIKATPNPSFVANQFCGKKPTTFNNTTFEELPSPTYDWNFSDGLRSALKNFTRTWPSEGPYSVTLKASYSNGCSASTTQDVEVLIQPKADFNVQDICSGEAANFVNLSKGDKGGIQYNWDFGNGTYSTVEAPVRLFNPTTTTTYTVSLVASYAGACSDTIRKTLTVSESPVTDFTSKDLGLMQVSFKPTNLTYSKYEWFFGEGGTSTQTQPVYQYLYTGNFNVTLKATNAAGCATSITKRASATTNINSFNNNNAISIYPNPNNGKFTVNNPEANTINIEVFNVLGEKVYSKISNEANTVVELNNHAKGVYLVKVTSNGTTTTTRITVAN